MILVIVLHFHIKIPHEDLIPALGEIQTNGSRRWMSSWQAAGKDNSDSWILIKQHIHIHGITREATGFQAELQMITNINLELKKETTEAS